MKTYPKSTTTRRSASRILAGSILALLAISGVRADTIPPSQDTSSTGGKLTLVNGKATTLVVTGVRKSFVYFDLNNLPADVLPADIAQAKLRIYFPTVVKAGDLTLHTVTPSATLWSESAAVAVAEPAIDANPIPTVLQASVVAKKFVEIDVTNIVRAWRATPGSNFGFAFTATGLTSVTLGAKEGPGSGYPCTLEVEIDRDTAAGSIDSTQLADSSITAPKLSPGSALANLAVGSITLDKLATSSLTINPGAGLTGGGVVALGGTVTVALRSDLTLGGTTTGKFVGDGSGLTNLSVSQSLADGSVGNAKLANNSITITAGAGLTGGGTVALGGTTTVSLASDLTLAGTTTGSFSGSLLLPAGTVTSAPLRLKTGVNLSNPVFGAVEFDGTNLFLTNNTASPIRKTIAFTDSTVSAAQIATGAIGNTQLASDLTLGGVTNGSFSGVLNGNASSATSATTAGSALTFTGNLLGDVTGTQGATVVSSVGGLSAANVAAGANLAGAATGANTANTIVKRDASGSFIAGTITGIFTGDGSSLTNLSASALANGSVSNAKLTSSSITVTPGTGLTGGGAVSLGGSTTLSLGSALTLSGTTTFGGTALLPAGTGNLAPLRLQTGVNLTTPAFGSVEFDGTNLFLTNNSPSPTRKTIAFTDSTITSAQIAAGAVGSTQIANGAVGATQLGSNLTLNGTTGGIFNGPLTGNVTGNVTGSAASFTGALSGDVTGLQGSTSVANVGGKTAAAVATSVTLTSAATSSSTGSTLVLRDASGNFTAGTITGSLLGNVTGNVSGSAASFTGLLAGEISGGQLNTVLSTTAVTGKQLTGFTSGAGTISATDTVLTAINKLNGNVALSAPLASPTFTGTVTAPTFSGNVNGNVTGSAGSFTGNLTGDVTGGQGSTAIAATTVTGKALTGFVSGAGTVTATDTVLTAINKLNGNVAAKANTAAPTFTGAVTAGSFVGDGSGLTGVTAASSTTQKSVSQIALLKWGPVKVNNTFPTGAYPASACFDGANIWVVNGNSGTVIKIDPMTGATLATFTVGAGPHGVCFDGTYIWVTNTNSGSVTRVNATSGGPTNFPAGASPTGICFDGTYVWVTNNGATNTVTRINPSTGATFGTAISVGAQPAEVCFDGTNIWVANSGGTTVTKILASNGSVVGTYQVGNNPVAICFDGASIWVTNTSANTVTRINPSSGTVISTYTGFAGPQGLCFDGTSIWVVNRNGPNVMTLNANTGAITGTYPTGTGPYEPCFDGRNVWVPISNGDSITRF